MPAVLRAPFAARSGQQDSGRDRQTNTRSSRPASSGEARPAARRPGPAAAAAGQSSVGQAQRRAHRGGRGGTGWRHGPCPGLGKWGRGAAAPLREEGRLAASCPFHLSHLHTSAILSACGEPVSRVVRPPSPPPPPPQPRPLGQRAAAGPCPGRRGRDLPVVVGRAGGPAGQEEVKRGGERRAAGSPGRSWQRGDAAARQGPAGEGACAAQVWRGVKIAAARLSLSSPPPSPAGGSAGRAPGEDRSRSQTKPRPRPESGAGEVEASPLQAMRGSRGLHPLFPVRSLRAEGRGLRPPAPVLGGPGGAAASGGSAEARQPPRSRV
ncbi:uncharacterized protein ACIBXB_017314 isoform 1-T3 [Morphnus guianensis]